MNEINVLSKTIPELKTLIGFNIGSTFGKIEKNRGIENRRIDSSIYYFKKREINSRILEDSVSFDEKFKKDTKDLKKIVDPKLTKIIIEKLSNDYSNYLIQIKEQTK